MNFQLIKLSLIFLSVPLVINGIRKPNIRPIQPSGIEFSYDDEPGIVLVAFHYSVNKPVPGVSAGEYNVDVRTRTGTKWVHQNRNVLLKPGDRVNYWMSVVKSGGAKDLKDQTWLFENQPEATRTQTTTRATPRQTTRRTRVTSRASRGTRGTTRRQQATSHWTPSPGTGPTSKSTSGKFGCASFPCLIFEDNFNNLNFDVWQHEITAGGGGNWEFQYYTNNRSNSYTKDGKLYIKPTLTEDKYGKGFLERGTLDIWGGSPADYCTGPQWYGCFRVGTATNLINPIASARLRTVNSFAFRYGKVEVRARMPKGDWLWPAIWMLPQKNEYGGWPASGEIDLVEARGNKNLRDPNSGKSVGIDQMGQTLHWGPSWTHNKYALTHASRNAKSGDFASDFHKYGMEWTENYIKFFLDDELVNTIDPGADGFWKFGDLEKTNMENPWREGEKMAPFDKKFHFILNLAVGGTAYFADHFVASPPKPWNNNSPHAIRDFWQGRHSFLSSWNLDKNNGESAALVVDYIRVWKLKHDDETTSL